jgi:YidC/Oxa1 family membrane protein insertase
VERRALLAIGLSVGILLLWQVLFAPPAPPPPPPADTSAPAAGSAAPAGPGGSPPPQAVGSLPRAGAASGGAVAEVVTPLYRVAFRGDGGVESWILDYRGAKPLLASAALPPLSVVLARSGQAGEVVALTPDATRLELGAGRPEGALTFRGTGSGGLRIERTLRFRADGYVIDLDLRAEGLSGGPVDIIVPWTGPVAVPGPTKEAPWLTFGEGAGHTQLLGRILLGRLGEQMDVFDYPAPALRDPKETAGAAELKDPALVTSELAPAGTRWAALENDYFIAALIPAEGGRLLRARERDLVQVGLVFPAVAVDAGRAWTGHGRLYTGPKEWNRLVALGAGLEGAQARNYGHLLYIPWLPMWWFCLPLLWLMNFLGTQLPVHNYGLAIILLTVLVKALFYPLTHKSMTSMKQMQALQPQLNALRSKYRSDPQRFQREQMDLFRKYRVNPMGGCLPMIVQVPIFYALYLTLQFSVELQGASFIWWITDLSKKDPYYVLPILMGASMMLQQYMTPTTGDPRQARIMLIMPVIFTFMFLEFPTGLVLYWLVNNILSVAQQMLIDRGAKRKGLLVEGRHEKESRKA